MDLDPKEKIADIIEELNELDEDREALIDAYFESDESETEYITLAVLEDILAEVSYLIEAIKKEIFYFKYDENIGGIIGKYEEKYKQDLGGKIFDQICEELQATDSEETEAETDIITLRKRLHCLENLYDDIESELDVLTDKLLPDDDEDLK